MQRVVIEYMGAAATACPGAGVVPGVPTLWVGKGGVELSNGSLVPVPQLSSITMTGARALIPPKKATSMGNFRNFRW